MTPVCDPLLADDDTVRYVVYGSGQSQYTPLPALVFDTGMVLTEWTFSDAERAAIARGENLRLWLHTNGQPLSPMTLEVTSEQRP